MTLLWCHPEVLRGISVDIFLTHKWEEGSGERLTAALEIIRGMKMSVEKITNQSFKESMQRPRILHISEVKTGYLFLFVNRDEAVKSGLRHKGYL